jgi:hypothetical protein
MNRFKAEKLISSIQLGADTYQLTNTYVDFEAYLVKVYRCDVDNNCELIHQRWGQLQLHSIFISPELEEVYLVTGRDQITWIFSADQNEVIYSNYFDEQDSEITWHAIRFEDDNIRVFSVETGFRFFINSCVREKDSCFVYPVRIVLDPSDDNWEPIFSKIDWKDWTNVDKVMFIRPSKQDPLRVQFLISDIVIYEYGGDGPGICFVEGCEVFE